MSYTRGELADFALSEIGISSTQFDITPEMRTEVVARMDMMLAEWASKGIGLGFPVSKEINTEPDDDTNIPDWAWKAVILNLACEMAPTYGKTVAMETKTGAKAAYSTLLRKCTDLRNIQLPSMPKGAGCKVFKDTRWTPTPSKIYVEPDDDTIDFSGEPE